jgi:hypothetical protein
MQEQLKREFQMESVNIITEFAPYPPNFYPQPKQPNNPYDSYAIGDSYADKSIGTGQLGTPVFANITFKGTTYTDVVNNTSKNVTFEDLTFDTVIMSVSQSKNIVTTEIQSRNGTVKEYIGMGDYNITINGIITLKNGNGVNPIEQVRQLKLMLNANKSIEVACTYLQNLDITNIVIKDYELPQEYGGYSYQKFVITALSDYPKEVYIVN